MNKKVVPIGEKIRQLRLKNAKTQSEVSASLSISRSCWSNYETGKREPDVLMLKRIMDYFGVDAGDFLENVKSATMCETEALKRVHSSSNIINTEKMSLSSRVALANFHSYLNFCDNVAKKEKGGKNAR